MTKLDCSAAVPAAVVADVRARADARDALAPLAGTTRLPPHRPFKIIYATLYYDVRPTFVVDITEQFEARFQSLMAYKTQFSDQEAGKDLFPAHKEIRNRIEAMATLLRNARRRGVRRAFPAERKSGWWTIC